jgi:phosphoserine phosphatase
MSNNPFGKISESEFLMLDLDRTLTDEEMSRAAGDIAAGKIAKGKDELKKNDYYNGLSDYVKGAIGGVLGAEVALDSVIFKTFMGKTVSELYANIRVHNILGFFKVSKQELQEASSSFVKKHEAKKARECLELIKKIGIAKKTVILTGSPSGFAESAARHFEVNYLVSPNKTKYNDDNTVKELEVGMRTPQQRLYIAKEKAKELNSDLQSWVYVTNNDDDTIFKGEVGLLVGYGDGKIKDHCDMHVKNWGDFESKLNEIYKG